MASMKLAYNVLDKQREREEAKLMQVDPKKAQQLERLGMAVAGGARISAALPSSGTGGSGGGISHSALSDMQIIQQDARPAATTSKSREKDFFDEFDSGFRSSSTRDTFFTRDDYDSSSSSFRGFGSCKQTHNTLIIPKL